MKQRKLPEELAWSGEHASEVALVAIGDGQVEIVPAAVLAHVETCVACNRAMAEAVMLSVSTGQALAAMARSESAPAASTAHLPVPWRSLLVAAALALVGATPALLDARGGLPSGAASLIKSAPLVLKSIGHLLRADARPLWTTLAPAAFLLLVGFVLTRALPSLASRRAQS